MKCPTCIIELKIADRQGIEIDYCPQCRGVWLDRGELDKIIERSAAADFDDNRHDRDDRNYRERSGEYDESRRYSGGKRKQRKSFLGEMFDMLG
jgi:Zn-finger nucleic acid-binding protein